MSEEPRVGTLERPTPPTRHRHTRSRADLHSASAASLARLSLADGAREAEGQQAQREGEQGKDTLAYREQEDKEVGRITLSFHRLIRLPGGLKKRLVGEGVQTAVSEPDSLY